eukprot:245162-Chlamydomonas_euryale.AAC.2
MPGMPLRIASGVLSTTTWTQTRSSPSTRVCPAEGMNVALRNVYAPLRVCEAQPKSTLRLGMNVAFRHVYAPLRVCKHQQQPNGTYQRPTTQRLGTQSNTPPDTTTATARACASQAGQRGWNKNVEGRSNKSVMGVWNKSAKGGQRALPWYLFGRQAGACSEHCPVL